MPTQPLHTRKETTFRRLRQAPRPPGATGRSVSIPWRLLAGIAWSIGWLAGCSTPPVAAAPVPVTLTIGESRKFSAEPGDIFELQLQPPKTASADSFLWITAEQDGSDLVLTSKDPDHPEPLTVDWPPDRFGPERIVIPLPSAPLELEIRAKTRGRFGFITEIRNPESVSDRSRVAAGRHGTTAARLWHQGTAETKEKALRQLRRALDLWREQRDLPEQAWTLFHLGALARDLGALDQAQADLEEARGLFAQLGQAPGEAMALNEIGLVLWSRGEIRSAREVYEDALERRRTLQDPCGQAQTSSNLGILHLQSSRPEQALQMFDRALELCGEGDPELQVALLLNIGGAHESLGQLDQAILRCLDALPLARALGQKQTEAVIHSNLGTYYRRLGQFQDAFESYRRAFELQQELGDPRRQGALLNNLGYAYLKLGEPARAIGTFEQALVLRRRAADRRGTAITLDNIGRARRDLGLLTPALEIFRQSLEIRRELGDDHGEARTLTLLGEALTDLGELDEAAQALHRALTIQRQSSDPAQLAWVLLHLGRQLIASGDPAAARSRLAEALPLFHRVRDPVGEARLLTTRAQAELALGDHQAALGDLERTMTLVETVHDGLYDPDLRATFLAVQHDAYEAAIDLHMELANGPRRDEHFRLALETAERSRARSLLTLLSESRIEPTEAGDLLLQRRQLGQSLRSTADGYRKMLRIQDPERTQEMAREIDRLVGHLEQLESELRSKGLRNRELTQPTTSSSYHMQAELDSDTTLFHFSLGTKRSFLWVATRHTLDTFQLPSRAEIEDRAREVYQAWSTFDVRGQEREAAAAASLSQVILEPAAKYLQPGRRLVVIADGALHYLPFAALPRPSSAPGERWPGRRLLIEDHEILTLPSASVLALQRNSRDVVRAKRSITGKNTTAARNSIAVVADPIFSTDDPRIQQPAPGTSALWLGSPDQDSGGEDQARLLATRLEAEAIAELAHATADIDLYLGARASRAAIVGGALEGSRTIHFATHGLLDSQRPRLSGLQLSRFDTGGHALDGFLTLRDIHNLHLDADLVVLSGCGTALGRAIEGEGLVGLTRGFLYAGSSRVIASLWRVQDGATASLMSSFYRALLIEDETPAKALRTAQLTLMQTPAWQDPYFWASFVHSGDWR